MADFVYPSLRRGLAKNTIDLTGKLKVLLVTSKYEPSAKHKNRDDITHEVKGFGYESGGKIVDNNKIVDVNENETVLKADDVIWPQSTISATASILYYSSGAGAKYDELICYNAFEKETSSTNGDFKVVWDKDGILSIVTEDN